MTIEERKDKIIEILERNIPREGIADFLKYLQKETDFFEAPCSTKFHLSKKGGLAEHSLNVYNLLKEKVERYKLEATPSTVAICGLLHDLCKTNFYTEGTKWVKIDGGWQEQRVFLVEEQFPVGHGEKSVFLTQRFMKLTDEEIAAIRWHMMAFDASIHFDYPNGFPYRTAVQKYPLVTLLACADLEASNILEREEK